LLWKEAVCRHCIGQALRQNIVAKANLLNPLGINGTAGRPNTTNLVFELRNAAGKAITTAGTEVRFSLSNTTSVDPSIQLNNVPWGTLRAGAGFLPVSSDANGLVSVTLTSGSLPTPLSVVAKTTIAGGQEIIKSSSQIQIIGGAATQDFMDLSATRLNIEGWNYSGDSSTLTVRLRDRFGLPQPGVPVTFYAEGGGFESMTGGQTTQCTKFLRYVGTQHKNLFPLIFRRILHQYYQLMVILIFLITL
jgi:hypothetical protein